MTRRGGETEKVLRRIYKNLILAGIKREKSAIKYHGPSKQFLLGQAQAYECAADGIVWPEIRELRRRKK